MISSFRFIAIILGLSLLIVVGGYFLKQNLKTKTQTSQKQDTSQESTAQPLRDASGLPADPATSSGKTVEDFVKTVKEDAKESADLSIFNCKAEPGVIKVKEGQKITIKNNDDKDIILQVSLGAQPKIEAKKSLIFAFNIEPAIYTYGCDHVGGDSVSKSGVLYVEK